MDPATPRFQEISDLDPDVAGALLLWGLSLADTKHKLGLRTAEWVNGAPALEAAVGAAAITQDELGHARSLYNMLSLFPEAPSELGTETDLKNRTSYYSPSQLDAPWESWHDVIAANVLIDRALSIAIASTRESQFSLLQQRAGKILQEERFHRVFGDSWLSSLATRDNDQHALLQAALNRHWPTALAWIGPEEDPASVALCDTQILTATPAEVRESWLAQITPLLDQHGLDRPGTEMAWSRWRVERRDIIEEC